MDISGVLAQVKSGIGFTNPISSKVNAAMAGLTIPSLATLTSTANAQAILQGVSVPSTLQLETAYNSMINASNKVGDLLAHTDKLSGVNLSGNGTLATIAKTVQSAKGINGDKSCTNVLAAFGSIQKSAEFITSTVNTVNDIKSFLLNIPGQINSIPGIIESYANKVVQQIAADVGVLAQAQVAIIQHSVAQNMISLFQDECTSQVLAAVMTQDMKNEVTKVTNEIKAKKLISIKGL